jgi:hypothetical protein
MKSRQRLGLLVKNDKHAQHRLHANHTPAQTSPKQGPQAFIPGAQQRDDRPQNDQKHACGAKPGVSKIQIGVQIVCLWKPATGGIRRGKGRNGQSSPEMPHRSAKDQLAIDCANARPNPSAKTGGGGIPEGRRLVSQ